MSSIFDDNITIPELKEIATEAIAIKRPLMIWGPPGIGKSEAIHQIGTVDNRPVVDVRLLLLEPTDLRGMPWLIDDVNKPGEKIVKWYPLGELPQEGTSLENAILVLEELPSAPPMMQSAAYQLVLDRRIGEYHLPPGVDIMAAGNRITDKAGTFRMPSPLANRFIHVNLRADWTAWKEWAINNNVHPEIITFLLEGQGAKLMKFDPSRPEHAFATPRTWVYASDVARRCIGRLDDRLTKITIGGCIGNGLAGEFMEWRRFADQLPPATKILSGEITKAPKLTEMSAKFLVSTHLTQTLKGYMDKHQIIRRVRADEQSAELEEIRQNLDEMVNNFISFMLTCVKGEIAVYAIRQAINQETPMRYGRIPAFRKFAKELGPLIDIDND